MESQNAFLTSKSRQKSLAIIKFYYQNPSKIHEKSANKSKSEVQERFFSSSNVKNLILRAKLDF